MNSNRKALSLEELEAVNGGGFFDFLWNTGKKVAETTYDIRDKVKEIIINIF